MNIKSTHRGTEGGREPGSSSVCRDRAGFDRRQDPCLRRFWSLTSLPLGNVAHSTALLLGERVFLELSELWAWLTLK